VPEGNNGGIVPTTNPSLNSNVEWLELGEGRTQGVTVVYFVMCIKSCALGGIAGGGGTAALYAADMR